MPKLIWFVMFFLIRSVSASDVYPHLTAEDQRRIGRLPEEKRELVSELTDYIRSESERLGLDPAEALGDTPNGIDDREYRRRRLEALQAKREKKAEEVRKMHERQAKRLRETGRQEESITADEASLMLGKHLGIAQNKSVGRGSDDASVFFEAPVADEDVTEMFADSDASEDELRYPGNIDLRRLFEEEKQRRRMHDADDAWMPGKPSERLIEKPISLRTDKHVWSDIASKRAAEGIVRVSVEEKIPDQSFAELMRQTEKRAASAADTEALQSLKRKAEKSAERYSSDAVRTLEPDDGRGDFSVPDTAKSVRRFVIFISESMGTERLRALFKAYAGDDSVHFVLRGFRGSGTISEGLKNILETTRNIDPVPNIEINPELFRRLKVDRVPAMLVEEIKPGQESKNDTLRSAVTEDLYAIYAEKFGVSAAERMLAGTLLRNTPARYEARLLVYGVVSRDWAERKIEEGAEFNQGTQGTVYEIIEPDLEDVMKQRALAVDWNSKKEAALKRYWTNASKHYVRLSAALHDEVRTVDPSFIAPSDLYDAAGIVIVRKATRINPLDHVPFAQVLIIFDATDAAQLPIVDSLLNEKAEENRPVKLIATEIDSEQGWDQFNALVERWKQPLYLLTPELKERFALKAVPATVSASKEEGKLLVREFAVKGTRQGRKQDASVRGQN